ncbi:hypothetical protein ACSBR1_025469 [Camellia fascicularis]
MEELKSAMGEHVDQMADLVEKLTAELRSGLRPAFDNFIGFFHAIDWTEPWLICLMSFHVVLLLVVIISRKNINFHMCLFLLALAGVYFAETLNSSLRDNWKSFAGQNYFDPQGLFLSVRWTLSLSALVRASSCHCNNNIGKHPLLLMLSNCEVETNRIDLLFCFTSQVTSFEFGKEAYQSWSLVVEAGPLLVSL